MSGDEMPEYSESMPEYPERVSESSGPGVPPFAHWYRLIPGRYVRRIETWDELRESETDRAINVAETWLPGDVYISTVFTRLDHRLATGFHGGPPILWETLIQGGPLDGFVWRYPNLTQAIYGHLDAVALAKTLDRRGGAGENS